MTEDRVGFLCKIAASLSPKNDTYKMLRSYYLMRCNEVTKGYGLPQKYFSSKARCPHCYLDWSRESDIKVQPLKLSKKQRQRLKSQKKKEHSKDKSKEQLRYQNEMVQICTLCRKSTTTRLIKPERNQYKSISLKENNSKINETKPEKKVQNKQNTIKTLKSSIQKKKDNVVNIYTKAFDVFSLKNEKNTLSSSIKIPPKVIKNNKKRKDKFAGLSQIAVLASAKLKEQKDKQTQQSSQNNKLNLFLKPSSG